MYTVKIDDPEQAALFNQAWMSDYHHKMLEKTCEIIWKHKDEELKHYLKGEFECAFDTRQIDVRKLWKAVHGIKTPCPSSDTPNDIGVKTPITDFILEDNEGQVVKHDDFLNHY